MDVCSAVDEFLKRHAVRGVGIVAVSGGPDSVALFRALREVYPQPVIVAHANHQLRGAESDADEQFVRELAAQQQCEFRSVRLTIPTDENLEGAARRLRYDWLNSHGGDWIATGHTADDQAETVLHRLIRGTGLQGLRGIAENRDTILRPLLHVARKDVLAYLAAIEQPARTDSTNSDLRFTRNRIRHTLLPLLREFNPEMVAVLTRLAEHSAEAFAFLESQAATLRQQAERPRAGNRLIFDRATLDAASPFLVRELFRLVWRCEGWPMDAMSAAHWDRVASLVTGDYPAGVRVNVVGRVLQLERKAGGR